ncbi:RNA polymerase sigma-70 factor [Chitinophaga sancti]|uniref:RNA polymerase sigma-70 factor n=1 Tax=Chitinophaga sancti TaxID=1004 RepID=A0A1K1T1H2_9BACT|nr:RNA polymerase sigma-70 factor [Chitinophaga sancti]WQD63842.1 RNA polymerase sigma-70 factor [Chitinophaga sancti]WQG90533.1 RNA polymerase sigma-70 factor [Chitinophaga sancti]SFW90448.1 RNA polymerase sigma-70 factor, ECF subfamily [Chitinophaga sancti]
MSDQDNELFARICEKDHAAFEQLYLTHHRRLLVLAFQYLRNEELAEEIVNDILMKIWTDASRLDITYSLGKYLSKSVVNRCLNTIRKQKGIMGKFAKYRADVQDTMQIEDEAAILEERLIRLENILDTLPPQCKKIIMLSKFEKCKQQEIADRLNISIKTVKNQLTIAYEKIRNGTIITVILVNVFAFIRTIF